jgi:hypothetical protein
LLSGVVLAINNVATGQIVEDEKSESGSKLLAGHLTPGPYELIVYGHECITNIDPEQDHAFNSFDLLLQMSVRLVRVSDRFAGADSGSNIGIEMLDYGDRGRSSDDQP